jgi:hypothetical protein
MSTRRVTWACGHATVLPIVKPKTLWKKIKTALVAKPPTDVESPALCSKCFLIQAADDRERGLNLLARSQQRAAPAARGTAETVQAIAFGQDSATINALCSAQQQSAAAVMMTTQNSVREATVAQQVTALNATIDLIRAANFWVEIHIGHHSDLPLYEQPVQSGPNNCSECLAVQLSLVSPGYRRQTTFNDVQRIGTPSNDSVDSFPSFRAGSTNYADEDAIVYARGTQDDWNRYYGPEAARAPAPSRLLSPHRSLIPESPVFHWPTMRRGSRHREPVSPTAEQHQGEVEEEWHQLVDRPPQTLLDRLTNRKSRSPKLLTALAERPAALGTVIEESHSRGVNQSCPLPRPEAPIELYHQETPGDEEPAAQQTRCQLRVPALEHPKSPPPRGTRNPEISVTFAHPETQEDEEVTVQQECKLQAPQRDQSPTPPPGDESHLRGPPRRCQSPARQPTGAEAHVWRPSQPNHRAEAFPFTADFTPHTIPRNAPLEGERGLTAAESQPFPEYQEMWIQEEIEPSASEMTNPHSLAGQVALPRLAQFLSLPSNLTAAEVQMSRSARLSFWMKADTIQNPDFRRRLTVHPRIEDLRARREFFETWRSIDWKLAAYRPHQPSEQDVAVNVPLPEADWDEYEFLGVTEMDIAIRLELPEGTYETDEKVQEEPRSQIHTFLRCKTTPIEPAENELEHRVYRPSSLRTELILEVEEESSDDEEGEVSGWSESDSESEGEAPLQPQLRTIPTPIKPPERELEHRAFEPSPLRGEIIVEDAESEKDNEMMYSDFVLNWFLVSPTQTQPLGAQETQRKEEEEEMALEEAKIGRKLI